MIEGARRRAQTVRVKLCGLMRPEDIAIVNEARPGYAGFILAAGRRRTLQPERMRELTQLLDPGILRVAVFLDQDREWIRELAREDLMDVIQLHGSESEEDILWLKERTGLSVIKAFQIRGIGDVEKARMSPADHVLLDHGAGGTGESFDWTLIREIGRDFFLAGGLGPENVADAIRQTCPTAVDVSSGVETDGRKDRDKVQRFMREVRSIFPL